MTSIENAIVKNMQTFVSFARKRLGDHHLAEDVVQESLVKALMSDRHPETDEETIPWFYRILRRSIIDVYRKQGARGRAMERFKEEFPETPDEGEEQELCQCLRRLLTFVPTQYRELLEAVDLKGKDLETAATELGLKKGHLAVKLHRARKHLRKALTANCRACSVHGCLDCTCDTSQETAH